MLRLKLKVVREHGLVRELAFLLLVANKWSTDYEMGISRR